MVANWLRQQKCQIIPVSVAYGKNGIKETIRGIVFYAMNAVRGDYAE